MKTTAEFRFAKPGDEQTVLDFIHGIAKYEKLENQVVNTVEMLNKELFVDKSIEVLFVLEQDKPVCFALFFHNYSTFLGRCGLYLEDFFVLPEYRHKGYGKALFCKLASIAVERNWGRMEWVCLDWNKPSIDFYKSMQAQTMDGWSTYRLTGDTLKNVADLSK